MSRIPRTPISFLEVCTFPKYDGKLWKEVLEEDRPYVEWLVSYDGPPMQEEVYDYLLNLLEE